MAENKVSLCRLPSTIHVCILLLFVYELSTVISDLLAPSFAVHPNLVISHFKNWGCLRYNLQYAQDWRMMLNSDIGAQHL